MARFQINPAADGVIEFEMTDDEGATRVTAMLTPEQSQGLVDLLGAARMITPGAVAAEPAEGVVQAVVDPNWVAPPYRAPQGRVLIVKHPGFGWIHFIFPDERAEQVSKVLATEFPAFTPPPSSVN